MFGGLVSLAMGLALSVTLVRSINSGEIWAWWTIRRKSRPVLFLSLMLLLLIVSVGSFASAIRQLT